VRLALVVLVALTTSAAAAKPRWQQLPMPPEMPVADDHGTVDVNGAQIYYARYGKGDPVILLHANTGTVEAWQKQIPALAQAGYRVIAFDRPGRGKSILGAGMKPPNATDTLDALVDIQKRTGLFAVAPDLD